MRQNLTSYTQTYLSGSDTHTQETQYHTSRTPTLGELDGVENNED